MLAASRITHTCSLPLAEQLVYRSSLWRCVSGQNWVTCASWSFPELWRWSKGLPFCGLAQVAKCLGPTLAPEHTSCWIIVVCGFLPLHGCASTDSGWPQFFKDLDLARQYVLWFCLVSLCFCSGGVWWARDRREQLAYVSWSFSGLSRCPSPTLAASTCPSKYEKLFFGRF